ncbi:14223_t:CDS:2, partial [Funneliformis geosporum]
SNKEKTDSSSQQKTNPPLHELSDQELKKCLLEDFSRRLDLKKYFVFNVGELTKEKVFHGEILPNGEVVNKVEYGNSRKANSSLARDLTKLSNSYNQGGKNFKDDNIDYTYGAEAMGGNRKEKVLEVLKTDPALTGFVVIDNLTQKLGVELQQKKFNGLYFQTSEYLLLKPQTYMNNSGECITAFLNYFRIPLDNLLVICDDIALPLGKFRYRSQGSDGGHNGMKNIINLLKSKNFKRLRVGIDYDRNLLIRD